MSLSHSPQIVTDGLVLCLDAANGRSYPKTGTTWTDVSSTRTAKTYSFSLINGAFFDSANRGGIVFDGTNDYAEFNGGLHDEFTTEEVTVCSFCQIGADVYKNSLFTFYGSTGDNDFSWHTFFLPCYRLSGSANNGVEQLFWNNTSGWEGGSNSVSDFDIDKWYFLCWTISGTTLKFYSDGVHHGTATLTDSTNGKFNPRNEMARIARAASSGEYGNGKIANIFIYNRALEDSEILKNYLQIKKRYK